VSVRFLVSTVVAWVSSCPSADPYARGLYGYYEHSPSIYPPYDSPSVEAIAEHYGYNSHFETLGKRNNIPAGFVRYEDPNQPAQPPQSEGPSGPVEERVGPSLFVAHFESGSVGLVLEGNDKGVLCAAGVSSDGPAAANGIQVGDCLETANGQRVTSTTDLSILEARPLTLVFARMASEFTKADACDAEVSKATATPQATTAPQAEGKSTRGYNPYNLYDVEDEGVTESLKTIDLQRRLEASAAAMGPRPTHKSFGRGYT